MDPLYDVDTLEALRTLKDDAATLADLMALDSRPTIEGWTQAVDNRLLPRLTPEFPLVAAICGGGSSGKSTLFNTLISLSASHRDTPGIAASLFEPFGCPPRKMEQMAQLTTPGDPLLHYGNALPPGLALVDTPDFDTGSGGSYQNRELAERSLRAADVLIYIFTNANYNNRDNTDFVARMLTAVGTRKCFLVYRAYPGFTHQEVLDHAATVAQNLYGDRAGQHVLGVYRAVEDNRVAAGLRSMTIVPVEDGRPALMDALARMDPRQIRRELHRSLFGDVIRQGRGFLEDARTSARHLELYLEGLRTVQQRMVQDALGHLPMDAVVRRFSEIWQDTDPSHVKIMRRTGRVVETPVRLLMRAARWIGGSRKKQDEAPAGAGMAAALEADLVRAASRLRQAAVDPALELQLPETDPRVGPIREAAGRLAGTGRVSNPRSDAGMVSLQVAVPPALTEAQTALRTGNWSAAVDDMLSRQEALLGLTGQLEADLQHLAREQRSRMTAVDQIRQTFSAMLNIIPATAAVTYVLHTGDPVGAVGIKVKLAGLFGLNDLYALVAIPATAGMKKADLKQLEVLLAPVARAWLTHKLTAIEALFEEKITGFLLNRGQDVAKQAAGRIASMTQNLARCGRALEKTA